jgi:uncharacterized protein YaiI (UPF0178 family)
MRNLTKIFTGHYSLENYQRRTYNIIVEGENTADNSVFPYSNANDMRVTQDLNSFGGDYRSCALFS